jgi:hypothetical protein
MAQATQPAPKAVETESGRKPPILLIALFALVCVGGLTFYLVNGSSRSVEGAVKDTDRVEKLEKTVEAQSLAIKKIESRVMKLEAEAAKQTQLLEAIKKYITENTGGAQPKQN